MTLIGILGGAAITALFPPSTNQFAGYAIGLAIGFFAYFIVLLLLVAKSADFNSDWFLDGRRKNPAEGWGYGRRLNVPWVPTRRLTIDGDFGVEP